MEHNVRYTCHWSDDGGTPVCCWMAVLVLFGGTLLWRCVLVEWM